MSSMTVLEGTVEGYARPFSALLCTPGGCTLKTREHCLGSLALWLPNGPGQWSHEQGDQRKHGISPALSPFGARILAVAISYNNSSCLVVWLSWPQLFGSGSTFCSLCPLKPSTHNDFLLCWSYGALISLFVSLNLCKKSLYWTVFKIPVQGAICFLLKSPTEGPTKDFGFYSKDNDKMFMRFYQGSGIFAF